MTAAPAPRRHARRLHRRGSGDTIGRFGARTASLFAPLGVDLILVDHRGYAYRAFLQRLD